MFNMFTITEASMPNDHRSLVPLGFSVDYFRILLDPWRWDSLKILKTSFFPGSDGVNHLDIAVYDSGLVTLDHGVNHLAEIDPGYTFPQRSSAVLLDDLTEILARIHPLHDNNKLFTDIAVVDEIDDTIDVRHAIQQITFQRHFLLTYL